MIVNPCCEYTDDLTEAQEEWTEFIQLDYTRMDLEGPTGADTVYVCTKSAALDLLIHWNRRGSRFVFSPLSTSTIRRPVMADSTAVHGAKRG